MILLDQNHNFRLLLVLNIFFYFEKGDDHDKEQNSNALVDPKLQWYKKESLGGENIITFPCLLPWL